MDKVEFINQLCEKWIVAATANEGITIGESESYRLVRNKILFQELSLTELNAAGICITRTLLLKGLNTFVTSDHFLFWSWAAEVILGSGDLFSVRDEIELYQLFDIVVRSNLANVYPSTNEREYIYLIQKIRELTEFNARKLLEHSNLISAYLGFPLLEGVCKKFCSKYIDFNGTVRIEFYSPDGTRKYSVGQKCNNVGHMLYLLHTKIASISLEATLTDLIEHVEQFGENKNGYEVISEWRNASLHGETSYPTIGGTLLSFSLLICLDQLADKYEEKRQTILKKLQREQFERMSGSRSLSYFPPSWSIMP